MLKPTGYIIRVLYTLGQSNTCDRILIFFKDLLAGMKFDTIKIFHAKTTERKQENCEIRQLPTKKETKFVQVYHNSATTLTTGTK